VKEDSCACPAHDAIFRPRLQQQWHFKDDY